MSAMNKFQASLSDEQLGAYFAVEYDPDCDQKLEEILTYPQYQLYLKTKEEKNAHEYDDNLEDELMDILSITQYKLFIEYKQSNKPSQEPSDSRDTFLDSLNDKQLGCFLAHEFNDNLENKLEYLLTPTQWKLFIEYKQSNKPSPKSIDSRDAFFASLHDVQLGFFYAHEFDEDLENLLEDELNVHQMMLFLKYKEDCTYVPKSSGLQSTAKPLQMYSGTSDYHFDNKLLRKLKENGNFVWLDIWRKSQVDVEMKEFDRWRENAMEDHFLSFLTGLERGEFVSLMTDSMETDFIASLSQEKQAVYNQWKRRTIPDVPPFIDDLQMSDVKKNIFRKIAIRRDYEALDRCMRSFPEVMEMYEWWKEATELAKLDSTGHLQEKRDKVDEWTDKLSKLNLELKLIETRVEQIDMRQEHAIKENAGKEELQKFPQTKQHTTKTTIVKKTAETNVKAPSQTHTFQKPTTVLRKMPQQKASRVHKCQQPFFIELPSDKIIKGSILERLSLRIYREAVKTLYDVRFSFEIDRCILIILLNGPSNDAILKATTDIWDKMRPLQNYKVVLSDKIKQFWENLTIKEKGNFQNKWQVVVSAEKDNSQNLVMTTFCQTKIENALSQLGQKLEKSV